MIAEGLLLTVGMCVLIPLFFVLSILIFVVLVYTGVYTLKAAYHVAIFLSRVVYGLFTMSVAVLGTGYVFYSALLILNGQPASILRALTAVFFMLLGWSGLINFIRNGFRFSHAIPSYTSSYAPATTPFSNSSSYGYSSEASDITGIGDFQREYKAQLAQIEDERKEKEANDEYYANMAREAEVDHQAREEQKIANWNAEQEATAEFWRKHAEDEEYNRQAREKWSQPDE